MNREMRRKDLRATAILLFVLFFFSVSGFSQTGYSIEGYVYEEVGRNSKEPLQAATIAIVEYGLGTISNADGYYKINNIPSGTIKLSVQFIGKVTIERTIELTSNQVFDFVLKEENFRLDEVTVTAESNKSGQSTASKISSTAIEHLQAVSLGELLALTPGGITQNPTLNRSSQLTIRSTASPDGAIRNAKREDMNALGTAIIQDGAPISNNSNLQTMNPAVAGGTAAMSGLASPSGGLDTRTISLENVESVEIIRGVPSVEYGDLTSGAVLITSKAGITPLQVKARTNPNVYQFFAQKGFGLGRQRGNLNLSADYAYNVNKPTESYKHYQRASFKALYSNSFFDNRWRSNTVFDFVHGVDKRDLNPDDARYQRESKGRDDRFSINTNGTLFLNRDWLKNIRYVFSAAYTDRYGFSRELLNNATAPYSMTKVDGAVISNSPMRDLFDVNGNKLTNYTGVNEGDVAQYLPASYLSSNEIFGKEINLYGKVAATLYKKIGATDNRLLFGADMKSEGNVGRGKIFDPKAPPHRNLQALNASFRPRSYKEIPFLNQLSLYAEENFSVKIAQNNWLRVQGGVRYDMMSTAKTFLSPRINGTVEIVPEKLFVRGGFGISAKMPTLLYLYPEDAYFEYININEMTNEQIPETDRVFMTTTKVYNTENADLKVASNRKREVGLDLRLDVLNLTVSAFKEDLKDGYSMEPLFMPFTFNEYVRAGDDAAQPVYELKNSTPVLSKYFVPSNSLMVESEGVEFDLNIKRIPSIRTSFSFTGAWIHNRNYSNSYFYYDESGAGDRKDIGLYEPKMETRNSEQLSTALRAVHNIPDIGFVLTLTAETVWKDKDYYLFGNDTIPVAFISRKDGLMYDFDPAKKDDPEFAPLMRQRTDRYYIPEEYPPLMNFNINLTKEIGDFMRVSFFANNMFRSYPIAERKRDPGTFSRRNKQFFFGLEVNLLIR